jgi:anti-anti-sigma factor
MSFNIRINKHKGMQILEVSGRLINIDSEKFQKKLDSFCKKGYKKTIIDISDIKFIDSFGLGTLIQHHTELHKANKKMILLNTNPDPNTYIQRLFDITGLKRVFNFVTSLDNLN